MPSAAPRRALNLDRLWIDLQRSLGFVREGLEHCQSSDSLLGTNDNLAKCDATLVFAMLRILGKEGEKLQKRRQLVGSNDCRKSCC